MSVTPRSGGDRRWGLRSNLRTQRVFGTWTSFGHPSIAEVFGLVESDFLGIDLEHSTISLGQAQNIIGAAHAAQAACLPRVSSHNGEQIKRLLDAGADGIIVPMVSSVQEVRSIVEWCKYPPLGRRSYGVARAQTYGADFAEYTSAWNDRSSIIIQIESIAGVEAVNELLADESIDGAMIGPYDLSGSLGISGQLTDPRVLQACERVIEACHRHGKACGIQDIEPDRSRLQEAFDSGYTFVVLASDVFVLWKWAERMREVVSELRRL